ncbi:hypothetical protein [Lentzea nigeriaca]|uniref:hypothetical protein n=1 Tax=Lentzea nigeriaca TaxID=1128665 RepID=UPI0019562CA3|nr:hypothetical protein [Lentzea nigeriaca]MBM7864910.1 glucan phosphoethanolaminetransferase (alkaline phosphatase superfamily) [Lentzea nigeriaca]
MNTPVRQRTPFLHCAAGALIWYIAVVVAYGIAELRTGTEAPVTIVEVVVGAVAWAITSTLVWAFLLAVKARIQPWLLIVIALPIFGVIWFALHVVTFLFVVGFIMPR